MPVKTLLGPRPVPVSPGRDQPDARGGATRPFGMKIFFLPNERGTLAPS